MFAQLDLIVLWEWAGVTVHEEGVEERQCKVGERAKVAATGKGMFAAPDTSRPTICGGIQKKRHFIL